MLAGMLPAGLGNGAPAGREHVLSALPHTYLRPQDLPPAFSWGLQDGRSWLTLTRNQHMPRYCNSGWAHAPTSALADRVSIMNNATKPPMGPAPQVLLNCYEGGDCTGGDAGGIYAYAKQFGIPDDTVQSYHAEQKQCQPRACCVLSPFNSSPHASSPQHCSSPHLSCLIVVVVVLIARRTCGALLLQPNTRLPRRRPRPSRTLSALYGRRVWRCLRS